MGIISFACGYLIVGVFITGFFVGADWALKVHRHLAEYMCLPAFLFFWPVALLMAYRESRKEG